MSQKAVFLTLKKDPNFAKLCKGNQDEIISYIMHTSSEVKDLIKKDKVTAKKKKIDASEDFTLRLKSFLDRIEVSHSVIHFFSHFVVSF